MKNYLDLMKKIVVEGTKKSDTLSLFGETLEFDLREGLPLVTTRKINYEAAFGELAAFLTGTRDVRDFQAKGVKFWDHDCYKESWSKSPKKQSEHDLGKIYGYQWVHGFGFNQIEKLVNGLRFNPESRRHVMITYNPSDLDEMCLPPCYVSHQFYVEEGNKLNMLVHQRSADYCIGVPFDLASFALFQTILAKEADLIPHKMKVIFGDVHIYDTHYDLVPEQLSREPKVKPTLFLKEDVTISNFSTEQAFVSGYNPYDNIKFPFMVQN